MVKLNSDSLRRDIFQLLKGQGHDGLTKQIGTFLVKKKIFGSSVKRKKLNVKILIASLKALTIILLLETLLKLVAKYTKPTVTPRYCSKSRLGNLF
jgi:hypothetical protein